MLDLTYLKLRNKLDNKYLWQRYSRLCKKSGFKKSILTLSFDCDTHEDAGVVLELQEDLASLGIKSSFAVPGEILKANLSVYKELARRGCEFLNHGEKEHTLFNKENNRYESIFFYDEITENQVVEDIAQGHKTLVDCLGIKPSGWRTPHFGTYQKRMHFEVLYQKLSDLKYSYSSSRLPEYAFKKGPLVKQNRFDLVEIPVTGTTEYPFTILDSWRYFAAPNRDRNPSDYLVECENLSRICDEYPILVNLYADPSHVVNRAEFMQGIASISQQADSRYFRELF